MVEEPKVLTATPVIDTAIYASGDLIGTKMTLAGAAKLSRVGRINSIVIADQAKQDAAIDVIFFDSNPSTTTFTDNAALDVADADTLKIIASVKIVAADYSDFADNSVATKAVDLGFATVGGGDLYACLVSRGTPTYAAATDLQLRVVVLQNP